MKGLVQFLNESNDDTIKGYHYAEVGTTEEQEDADKAYSLYDKFSHKEIDADDLIKTINDECFVNKGDELETIHKANVLVLGYSKDKKFFVTYDKFSGALDTWEVE